MHGQVIGTATVGGKPYALARKRSTFGRDALNLAALKDLTEGKASTPERFWTAANQFGFTFNWAYVVAQGDGVLHARATCPSAPGGSTAGCRRSAPASYEWQGFLSRSAAPARRERAGRAAAQLEQQVGAGLHAR